MAGFDNDVIYGTNADFSNALNGTGASTTGELLTDGDLWVGSTATNAGGTHINVGNITSPGGSITIGYSSPDITIDVSGGGTAIEQITVDNSTVPGTNPVLPLAGNVTITGGQVTNASLANVIQTHSVAANSFAIQIQRATTAAATDSTKNGVSHFNSAQFTVDASGFVSASGSVPIQFTADSGTATPAAGNINILGGPGITTSATGSTVTINSVVFTDTTATTLVSDNGYFATAAGTYTLPATPAQGEMIIIVADTAGAVVVDAPSTHLIRIGSSITSAGGTLTSTAIGDSLTLRYRASSTTWMTVASMGNWTVA